MYTVCIYSLFAGGEKVPGLFSETIAAQRVNFLLRLINIAGCDDEKEAAMAFEWLGELMQQHSSSLNCLEKKTPGSGG